MFAMREKLKNALTTERDMYDKKRIASEFPDLKLTARDYCLSLRRHLDSRPERFFDRSAYRVYLDWLQARDATDATGLANYLSQNGNDIEKALLLLREVNRADWHDASFEAQDDYALLLLIDRQVHPAYLRLLEAVLAPLIKPIAYFSRIDRNKGTDGLNLWSIIQEINSTPESCLTSPYRHIVRKGIAHGGITFDQRKILYQDSKGNEETIPTESIVRLFDDLLDVCNGIAVALKVFFLGGPRKGYIPPRELLMEELQEETRAPWWEIVGSVETEIPGKSQLVIYARPNTRCYDKALWSSVQSGILSEFFAPGYDRYLISLRSEKILPGWIAFDGTKLKDLREAGADDFQHYKGTVEDDLMFFIPRLRAPALLCRLGTLVSAFKANFALAIQNMREEMKRQLGIPMIDFRFASAHRNSWASVLHASVVLVELEEADTQETIRKNQQQIVKLAKRAARRNDRFNLATYLPIGFAEVKVFRADYRERRLVGFGLGSDLVCTVSFRRLRQVRRPDLIGSTVESSGKWRIAWNRAWLDDSVTTSNNS